MMENDFSLQKWNNKKNTLQKKYPQLTSADLIWRHETKNDLYRSIAEKLGMTARAFEEIVESC
jgi:hypothetical protein